GDEVHLLTRGDLGRVYGQAASRSRVAIGSLASAEGVPAIVNIDLLVSRHSAVVGATGAGKSTTVASVIQALSDPERFASARVLVFDTHGEYSAALRGRATVFRIGADEKHGEQSLAIPYWAMT